MGRLQAAAGAPGTSRSEAGRAMTSFPGSPRLLKGAIVGVDPLKRPEFGLRVMV